jgi:hypothetical protein
MSYGDYEPKPGDQKRVPDIVADAAKPTEWIEPDAKQPLIFHAVGQSQPFNMAPLYKVIHERYAVYWKVDNKTSLLSEGMKNKLSISKRSPQVQ